MSMHYSSNRIQSYSLKYTMVQYTVISQFFVVIPYRFVTLDFICHW